MASKVRGYKSYELLNRVRKLDSFKRIPDGYWILGVQSKEDTYNEFDDKFYLFYGSRFIMVTTGTTNAGTTGLLNYNRYNNNGCAVIKTNEWYYDVWSFGYHRGKMPALKQRKPIKYYRDYNKNRRVEELGKLYEGMIGINFHTASYQKVLSFIRKLIGGWSVGCQVVNNLGRYYRMLDLVKYQEAVTYCLIKEF